MKAKYFLTYDPIYHKNVNSVNIIMSPEEKELFVKGLEEVSDSMSIGEKLKQFLREYKPYEPENEHKEFPDGAYNTVIFEDMFLHAFMDLISVVSSSGIMGETIRQMEKINKIMNETEDQYKKLNKTLNETIAAQEEHIKTLQKTINTYESIYGNGKLDNE